MNTVFFTRDLEPIAFACPKKTENTLSYSAAAGNATITVTEESIGPFVLRNYKIETTDPSELYLSMDMQQPTLCFMLKGSLTHKLPQTTDRWDTSRAYVVQGMLCQSRIHIPHTKQWQLFEIEMEPAWLNNHLQTFTKPKQSARYCYLAQPSRAYLSSDIIRLLVEIHFCMLKQPKREAFLLMKLCSLVSMTINENHSQAERNAHLISFSRAENLYQAIEILKKKEGMELNRLEQGRQAGITKDYQASFTHFLGIPISNFIQAYTLEKAMRKLVETNQSLDTIAAKAGFSMMCNFGKAYQNHFGLTTPIGFRKHLEIYARQLKSA